MALETEFSSSPAEGILPIAKSTTSLIQCTYCRSRNIEMFFASKDDLKLHENAIHRSEIDLFQFFARVGYADAEKRLLWDLPGHGDAYVDCGNVGVKGCDNVAGHEHGKVFARTFRRTCGRKACPTCFEAWASAQALRGLIRIASYAVGPDSVDKAISAVKLDFKTTSRSKQKNRVVSELEELLHSSRKKAIHVVLSPSPGIMDDDGSVDYYKRARRQAYDIAKECGLSGGAVIFHPYRLKCAKCGSTIDDYTDSCSNCGSSAFKWFWSAHFHVIGFGWIVNTKEAYESHGWVIRNLKVRKSVYWTFQYLLSHAGVHRTHSRSRIHTTSWFGLLSYNMLEDVPVLGVLYEVCPYCSRPLGRLEWIGGEDRGPPALEFDPHSSIDNEMLLEYTDWHVHQG